jgi:aminoglycoside/choline kinase family phosphotransferase
MEGLKKINFKKYSLLKGDASFRKFYRKKNKKSSSIIVFAKKEKKKNLLDYASVNKLLLNHKISVPKLISVN